MESQWRERIIATAIYTLVAVVVAWLNRESLYYLDGWVIFAPITAVPMLFFLGYYLWERAHPSAAMHREKILAISFTVVLSLATVWLLFTALCINIIAASMPINTVRKYDFIVSKWNSPFTAHFPRPIPAGARAVRFFCDPGFLQASSILELGYTTTPEQLDALFREYSHRSTFTFTAGTDNGAFQPVNYVAEDMQDPIHFSDDYTLFYLDEKPPTGENDIHGVAISKKRCRVVFWAWSG